MIIIRIFSFYSQATGQTSVDAVFSFSQSELGDRRNYALFFQGNVVPRARARCSFRSKLARHGPKVNLQSQCWISFEKCHATRISGVIFSVSAEQSRILRNRGPEPSACLIFTVSAPFGRESHDFEG